ncbi:PREDICTED: tripartite motif-containing protein 45-like [Amphimedon queenslandica]|uniref:Uncharacterized protein n=1 Tax=Amphimedon queenslandica TaxID=400682 RepID=A0A1X7UZE3_AMPQE|nr:PREDICTED: tripartite motif-containing protein 45-like [Amphimedon queenslandica]|eukprot:XP_019851499.1 PREDICTED: tripartite motif-containing protein 45-like [Amphimedon queenslandica]
MASKMTEICTICQSTYSDPRLLPCLHSFCRACLSRLPSVRSRTVKCPLCRTEHNLGTGGVDKLLANTQLAGKVSLPVQKCGQCRTQKVVSFCCECESYLCDLCHQAHTRMATFQTHKVVDPSQAQMKPKPKSFKCLNHPKELLDVYCVSCKVVICRDCALYTHQGHKFKPGEEAATDIKKRLKSNRDQLQTNLETFRSHAKTIALVEKHVTTYPDKMKSFITSHFEALKLQLEQRKATLLRDVDTQYNGFSKTLYCEKDIVETGICKLEAGINFADQLVRSADKLEVSILGTQVLLSMQESQTLSWNPSTIKNLGPLAYIAQVEANPYQAHDPYQNYHGAYPIASHSQHLGMSDILSNEEYLIQHIGLLRLVNNFELQLYPKGYQGHNASAKLKKSIVALMSASHLRGNERATFVKNGTYCIEAEVFLHQNKAIFPNLSISCKCNGPAPASASKKQINCSTAKVLGGDSEKWKITFQSLEAGDYEVTVKLLINDDEFSEKMTTITLERSGQVEVHSQQHYYNPQPRQVHWSQQDVYGYDYDD